MRVSVNITVLIFRLGPSKVSSINFLKPEGVRRRLSAYVHERAGGATVVARQNACTNCEEACERRHHDHKTHCYALDLLLEEGHRISRPQQVGAAFSDIKEHRKVHGQANGMDVDTNGKKPAKPYSKKSHMIY